jgi:hypothetical protein
MRNDDVAPGRSRKQQRSKTIVSDLTVRFGNLTTVDSATFRVDAMHRLREACA